jgi:hypothetical protein
MSEPPILLVFALCDQVIVDAQSGKRSLIGMFNEIRVNTLPTNYPQVVFFFSFTNWKGRKSIRLRITDPEKRIIFDNDSDYSSDSPINVLEFSVSIDGLILYHPGVYDVDILVDGEPMSLRQFNVKRENLTVLNVGKKK